MGQPWFRAPCNSTLCIILFLLVCTGFGKPSTQFIKIPSLPLKNRERLPLLTHNLSLFPHLSVIPPFLLFLLVPYPGSSSSLLCPHLAPRQPLGPLVILAPPRGQPASRERAPSRPVDLRDTTGASRLQQIPLSLFSLSQCLGRSPPPIIYYSLPSSLSFSGSWQLITFCQMPQNCFLLLTFFYQSKAGFPCRCTRRISAAGRS